MRVRTSSRFLVAMALGGLVWAGLAASACVNGAKATDSGDPGFPFGPSSIGIQALSYNQDVASILNTDCLRCHTSGDARGNYSVANYSATMNGQRAGDASSSLVVDCAPGGSMYQYFSGDRVTKATIVFRWMVYYSAAQTR